MRVNGISEMTLKSPKGDFFLYMAGVENTEGSAGMDNSPMDGRGEEMWFDLNEPHSSVHGSLHPPFINGRSLGEGDYPRTRSHPDAGLSFSTQINGENTALVQSGAEAEAEKPKNLQTVLDLGFDLNAANKILGLQEGWNEGIDFSLSSLNLERGSEEGFREWQRRNGFSD